MLNRFMLRYLRRFNTFARNCTRRTFIVACAAVNLNDNARNQFLNAFHFARLIRLLVIFATSTAAPLGEFPERRTRLTVTLHEALAHDGLSHVSAFLRRISFRRFASDTADDGLLRSASARFAARREAYHFP